MDWRLLGQTATPRCTGLEDVGSGCQHWGVGSDSRTLGTPGIAVLRCGLCVIDLWPEHRYTVLVARTGTQQWSARGRPEGLASEDSMERSLGDGANLVGAALATLVAEHS